MRTVGSSSPLAVALFLVSCHSTVSWHVLLPSNVTYDSMRGLENEVDVFAFGGNHQGQVSRAAATGSCRGIACFLRSWR
jgi:hypothetical protein